MKHARLFTMDKRFPSHLLGHGTEASLSSRKQWRLPPFLPSKTCRIGRGGVRALKIGHHVAASSTEMANPRQGFAPGGLLKVHLC